MRADDFVDIMGVDFYTGVPDSRLKNMCEFLMSYYGERSKHHIIAANEGNAAAIAAGYHLATGKTPLIYMQNSGEGNVINPIASLLSKDVYAIPAIFVIGWRGEPDTHDEPQHVMQGRITHKLLDMMEIVHHDVTKDTTEDELRGYMEEFKPVLSDGRCVALIIGKDAIEYVDIPICGPYRSYDGMMRREQIISHIVNTAGDDPIVCTTGKAGRELFEIRENLGKGHAADFLTVGSMGHCSSIALGIALSSHEKRVWCIDGDGSAIMHMGAMAVIGDVSPDNMVHIVINNGAHESVGAQPTAIRDKNIVNVAKELGYVRAYAVQTEDELIKVLDEVKSDKKLTFIEVLSAIGSRADLGRPTTTPQENKKSFMAHIQSI